MLKLPTLPTLQQVSEYFALPPFWTATCGMAAAYTAVTGLGVVLFYPVGVLLLYLANPLAAVAGEALYRTSASRKSSGWERPVMCLAGTAPAYVLGASLFGWLVSAMFAAGLLYVGDAIWSRSGPGPN
jgi:hypothetical protein